jgi:seryl-tRNA synthetase
VLDLRSIREDPDPVRAALSRRDPGLAGQLDRALELDERRRALLGQVEPLRAEQNKKSKLMAGKLSDEERASRRQELSALSATIDQLKSELDTVEAELYEVQARLPNPPDRSVPTGASDDDNEILKHWGDPPEFGFEARDHVALGEALGMIDIDRGVRTSGARFYYLTGPAVSVQFALMRYALDYVADSGHVPVVPPVLVREEAMFGTGFLPTDEAQIYVTREDDLYLVGTSEVSLASLHAGEILDPADLPKRYMGYSTCFRREAGTYGKDTRGIFRVHQFDKLELFSFVMPEESAAEHDRLLGWEEAWVQSLEVPYRVVNVCTGELGGPAAKKYDIEAWMPGQSAYREITSTSNTTDYQARRLDVRVRTGGGTRHPHTLNGTLCAMGRTLIALMENHQREDGSIEMPKVLRDYLPERDWVIKAR